MAFFRFNIDQYQATLERIRELEKEAVARVYEQLQLRREAGRVLGSCDQFGNIWLSPTEKMINGVVLVTAAQATYAKYHGWKRVKHSAAVNGLVAIERK